MSDDTIVHKTVSGGKSMVGMENKSISRVKITLWYFQNGRGPVINLISEQRDQYVRHSAAAIGLVRDSLC